MRFQVRALSADNRVTTLTVEAADEAGARQAAARQSLRPLSVKAAARLAVAYRRGNRFSLGLFSQELLALLEAGLSIVEALESLAERGSDSPTRGIVAALSEALRQGQRLSQAMAAQPQHFPALYVGIIQAAETTSELPSALARFVDFEQRASVMRTRAVSAAIYPLILLVVGGGVTLFLLGYVVPRFAVVYQESGRSMSVLTSFLLTSGRFIAEHSNAVLVAASCALAAAWLAWHRAKSRVTALDLLERLPLIREQVLHYELSRLYMTLGMLLAGGIPVLRALRMVEATVGARLRTSLQRAAPRIAAGEGFSSALQAEGLAADVSLRLFRVGEHAGTLGEMLIRAARFYDAEVSRFIDRFTRSAEPLLMAAIGLVVGSIVVLLYMPIFELAGSLL